jgi:hypothetical protein
VSLATRTLHVGGRFEGDGLSEVKPETFRKFILYGTGEEVRIELSVSRTICVVYKECRT